MGVFSNLFVRIMTYYMFYIQFLFGQKARMCIGHLPYGKGLKTITKEGGRVNKKVQPLSIFFAINNHLDININEIEQLFMFSGILANFFLLQSLIFTSISERSSIQTTELIMKYHTILEMGSHDFF